MRESEATALQGLPQIEAKLPSVASAKPKTLNTNGIEVTGYDGDTYIKSQGRGVEITEISLADNFGHQTLQVRAANYNVSDPEARNALLSSIEEAIPEAIVKIPNLDSKSSGSIIVIEADSEQSLFFVNKF